MPDSLLERAAGQVQVDIDLNIELALALFERNPDGIVIVDSGGVIRLVNDRAELISWYSRRTLIGQHVEMLIPEALRERHIGHRSGYMSDPRTRTMGETLELALLRQDGTAVPVLINLSPVPTRHGLFVIATIRPRAS